MVNLREESSNKVNCGGPAGVEHIGNIVSVLQNFKEPSERIMFSFVLFLHMSPSTENHKWHSAVLFQSTI